MSVSPQIISPPATLRHPYLWVVGQPSDERAIAQLPIGSLVGDRFQVVAAHLWQDLQPEVSLDRALAIPAQALPYMKLYPHRLHIPEVYGIYAMDEQSAEARDSFVLLLDNIPVNTAGALFPTLANRWEDVSPVRQLSWLWQMGQLWQGLSQEGVSASLLAADLIHVDGWRIRLRELVSGDATLHQLGTAWMPWAKTAHPSICDDLHTIVQAMQQPHATWDDVAPLLNQQVLRQAAQLPLRVDCAGATSPGAGRSPNEDACYPITLDLSGTSMSNGDDLSPRVAIVCDGIAGHAGGEVASHLTIRALKLQLRALFDDMADQDTPLAPDAVMRQIEAAIRVVNNLVAFQNDEQRRADRQRMGTTLVMALQIPQQIETPKGRSNTHEVYIAHVGDSRAYWLTPNDCHCLTVDDDVKAREVMAGRSLPQEAARRTDAIALTQALGTRSGEYLHLTIQRFIIDEDGVLLLCSDGLSDSGMIERYWQSMANNVLRGNLPLNKAVGTWLKLAHQQGGEDNASVVLMRCRVSKEAVALFDPSIETQPIHQQILSPQAAQSLSSSTSKTTRQTTKPSRRKATQKVKSSQKPTSPQKPPSKSRDVSPPPQSFAEVNLESSERLAPLTLDEFTTHSYVRINRSRDEHDELDEWARTLLEPDTQGLDQSDHHEQDWNVFAFAVGLSVVMFIAGAAGVIGWRKFAPASFNETLEQAIDLISDHLWPEDNPSSAPAEQPQESGGQ